jgi:ABC-type transport system involved in cytochrome c biogenesis permease subunit
VIAWCSYAALLSARVVFGWRGRKTAWLTLAGFGAALIVLAIYFLRRMSEG